jgi:hypothetical protein
VANYQYGMETIGDFAHSIFIFMFIEIVVDMFFPTIKSSINLLFVEFV